MSRSPKTGHSEWHSKDSEDLLGLLLRRIQGEALLNVHKRIQQLEKRLASFSTMPFVHDCEAKLFRQRIVGSATLNLSQLSVKEDSEADPLDNWMKANRLVTKFIESRREIDIKGVQKIHQQLIGAKHQSRWRETSSEITGVACPHPKDISQLMNKMIERLEALQEDVHPLFISAKMYEWMISTHPFEDANGRTARLVLDWHLGLHGFPPVSFRNQKETFVLLHPSFEKNYLAEHSVRVVLQGIENTLEVLFGGDPA